MKKYLNFIILIIASIIIFTGCSATKDIDNENTYVEKQDSQENLVSHQSMTCYASDDIKATILLKTIITEVFFFMQLINKHRSATLYATRVTAYMTRNYHMKNN